MAVWDSVSVDQVVSGPDMTSRNGMTRVHWSAMKAVPALKRFRSGLKMSFCAGIFTSAFVLSSCTPPEIHGSYDVEIEIVGVSEILSGTMILGTGMLDVPPLGAEERSAFGSENFGKCRFCQRAMRSTIAFRVESAR